MTQKSLVFTDKRHMWHMFVGKWQFFRLISTPVTDQGLIHPIPAFLLSFWSLILREDLRWWIWHQMINEDLTQIRLTLTVVFERDSPGTPSSSDILTSWLVFVFVFFLLHDLHLEHILLSQCKSWSTPQMNRKWFNLLNKQCQWCKSVHFESDIFCNRC